MELEDYGIDVEILRKMYNEWKVGESKSELERRYLGKAESHGKLFTSLVKRFLGEDTEKTHPMVSKNIALERENKGLRPEVECLKRELGSP